MGTLSSFTDHDFGYSLSPISSGFENLDRSVRQLTKLAEDAEDISDLETSDWLKVAKPVVQTLGAFRGLPSVQINRALDGWAANLDEEENWAFWDLLLGYDEDRALRRD